LLVTRCMDKYLISESKLPRRRDYRRKRAKKREALREENMNSLSPKCTGMSSMRRRKGENNFDDIVQPEEALSVTDEVPWTLMKSIRGAAAALVALRISSLSFDDDHSHNDVDEEEKKNQYQNDLSLLSLVDTCDAPPTTGLRIIDCGQV